MLAEFDRLKEYLGRPRTEIRYVLAPFIQSEVLAKLVRADDVPTVIVTRWRPSDLASRVSDPDVFTLAEERGWTFLTHERIHLKVYSWSLEDAIVGSANITASGLGLFENANEEMLVGPVDLPIDRRIQLNRLVQTATPITAADFETVINWLETLDPNPSPPTSFRLSQHHHDFMISALPSTPSLEEAANQLFEISTKGAEACDPLLRRAALHDAANYLGSLRQSDADKIRAALASGFLAHPFIRALDEALQPCMYFGELKAWIQVHCANVPVPSRRDLTGLAQALMLWFVQADPATYAMDVPGRFSQRLCKV